MQSAEAKVFQHTGVNDAMTSKGVYSNSLGTNITVKITAKMTVKITIKMTVKMTVKIMSCNKK